MNREFFIRNRRALLKHTNADAIVISGNISLQRSNDAAYMFEQEANFWYLTGIDSANWWVVIEKEKSYLVAPDVDDAHRLFDGSLSNKEAKDISGVDVVLKRKAGEKLVRSIKGSGAKVATIGNDPHVDHYDFSLNPGPVQMLDMLRGIFGDVIDCRHELAKLRAIKAPEEVQLIRNAIELTINSFETVRNGINQYSFEYEIEADFNHQFRRSGAIGHAYDPIVAAANNACTLHYGKNKAALVPGEFVLLDVGARLNGYPADITRTYAHGDVSDRHKAVHLAVETAHHKIIALLEPGLNV